MILLVEPGNFVIIYQFLMGFILTLLISVLSVNIKFLRFIGSIAIAGFDFTPIPAQHEWCSRIEDGKKLRKSSGEIQGDQLYKK